MIRVATCVEIVPDRLLGVGFDAALSDEPLKTSLGALAGHLGKDWKRSQRIGQSTKTQIEDLNTVILLQGIGKIDPTNLTQPVPMEKEYFQGFISCKHVS